MLKKSLSTLFLAVIMVLSSLTTAHASTLPSNYKAAKLNSAKCEINGKSVTLNAYNIDGHNYFKIRDLCKELDYFVKWNDSVQAVWIMSNQPYEYAEEKQVEQMETVNVAVENKWVYINAYSEEVKVVNIGGYNYFMLRDLQKVAELSMQFEESNKYFSVDWNVDTETIVIKKLEDGAKFGISKQMNNGNTPPSPTPTTIAPQDPTQSPINPVAPTQPTAPPINGNTPTEPTTYTTEEFQNEVLRLVNVEREKVGVAPLEADPLLMEIAMLKAKEMVDLNYYGHESPNYGKATAFAKHYGYSKNVAENIQAGFDFDYPQDIVNSWLDSEGHRKNMLNKDFLFMGFGYCINNSSEIFNYNNNTYVRTMKSVQMFSRK